MCNIPKTLHMYHTCNTHVIHLVVYWKPKQVSLFHSHSHIFNINCTVALKSPLPSTSLKLSCQQSYKMYNGYSTDSKIYKYVLLK